MFLENGEPEDVLRYLNDEFFEINVYYNSSNKLDENVKRVLSNALSMLGEAGELNG